MNLTPAAVADQREWVRQRGPVVVPLVNETRRELGTVFDADVAEIDRDQYREAVDAVFADGDLAVNVAALVALLRELDVEGDYPGFVVDELLGRELAGMLAGSQPLRLLGEATFHYADVHHHGGDSDAAEGEADEPAGLDDLDAALAAGVQTRLPGWEWRERESPFAADP
jgi:hypothetical protein